MVFDSFGVGHTRLAPFVWDTEGEFASEFLRNIRTSFCGAEVVELEDEVLARGVSVTSTCVK